MRHQSVTYLLVRTLARFAVAAAGLFVAGTIFYGAARFEPGAWIVLSMAGAIAAGTAISHLIETHRSKQGANR